MNKFIFVVGPTCSGKNDYAYELSKLIDIEVINADISYNDRLFRVIVSTPSFICGGENISDPFRIMIENDFDSDFVGDFSDLDDDNDNILDTEEIGGPTSTGYRYDHDNDGYVDMADTDDDNDGLSDWFENNDGNDMTGQFDHDNDGIDDVTDDDDDNDGILDVLEL